MMYDPRTVNFNSRLEGVWQSRKAVTYFVARALQLQARDQQEAALDHFLVALGVSRQVRSKAVTVAWLTGVGEELVVLQGFQHWLRRLGPRPDLLKRALDGLGRHEAQTPADWAKAQYFVLRNSPAFFGDFDPRRPPRMEDALVGPSQQIPWERERQERLINAIVGEANALLRGALEGADYKIPIEPVIHGPEEHLAWATGLGREGGPTTGLDPRAWGQLLFHSHLEVLLLDVPKILQAYGRSQCHVRAARLQAALALYQVQHGTPARSLGALVPRYLSAVPLDPFTGRAFHYRISRGEQIAEAEFQGPPGVEGSREVQPGQGVLRCEGQFPKVLLVPLWSKR